MIKLPTPYQCPPPQVTEPLLSPQAIQHCLPTHHVTMALRSSPPLPPPATSHPHTQVTEPLLSAQAIQGCLADSFVRGVASTRVMRYAAHQWKVRCAS